MLYLLRIAKFCGDSDFIKVPCHTLLFAAYIDSKFLFQADNMANPSYIYDPYRTAGAADTQAPEYPASFSPANYLDMLIPESVRRIQEEARKECSRLDHPGSILYDEYPDKEAILYLVDLIYDRILAPSNTFSSSGMFLPIEERNAQNTPSAKKRPDTGARDAEGRALFLISPLYDLVKMIVLQEVQNLLYPI